MSCPLGSVASSPTSAIPWGRLTTAVRRPSRSLQVGRRLPARAVVVKGQEDLGAAAQRSRHLVHALGTQGGHGGIAPGRQRQPVEDSFADYDPGGRGAEAGQPEHRLGAGHCLKTRLCACVNRPPGQPPHPPVGQIGHCDHPAEPLRAPFQEQAGVPEPRSAEASRRERLPQAVSRRVAQAQLQDGAGTDAPRGQVRPGLRTAPQLTGVEPRRRRQQRRIAGRNHGSNWCLGRHRTNRSGRNRRGTAVQPPYRLGQGQPLHPLHEVQYVAAGPATEAVELLAVGVHREAALGFPMKGADALPDPALAAERHTGGLHRVAQGMAGLEFRNVHRGVGYDHAAPPFARRFSPRRLRRESSLPTGQRIPRTAATASVLPSPSLSTSATALPVLGL